MKPNPSKGFSLVEMLLVLALIGMLSALLLPVLLQAKKTANKPVCASNLYQLGIALAQYAQDWDERYPLAKAHHPPDAKHPNAPLPNHPNPPLLRDLLRPYAPSQALWRCPADFGTQGERPIVTSDDEIVMIDLQPSLYERLGSSYQYHEKLGRSNVRYPAGSLSILAPDENPEGKPPIRYGPEETGVLADWYGFWHNPSRDSAVKDINILFADGHVERVSLVTFILTWTRDPI